MSQEEEGSADQAEGLIKKFCLHCQTTKTPMWRIGPSGPKSLCNACGIKFRKKSSEILKKEEKSRKRRPSDKSQDSSKNGCVEDGAKRKKSRKDMKVRLRGVGKEVALLTRQRSASSKRKMGEVEQAALLLMALSCASVSA